MNRLASNTKKAYYLLFLSLTTLLFLLVFIPMRHQLEYQVAENYSLLAESKRQIVMTLVNNCIVNANSLSSRSVIRDYIKLYNEGQIEWETLQSLTQPKYADGLKVIADLSLAIRCVDRQPLIVTGETGADFQRYIDLFGHTARTEYTFEGSGENIQIVVCSPITSNGQLLGHDIIAVDISAHLRQLAQNGFKIKISDAQNDAPTDIVPNTVYPRYAVEGKSCTLIALPISDRHLFWVGKPTREVFENFNRISLLSIVGFMLGLTVIFIILQISIVRLANSIIAEIGDSRDAYMRDANYDALTGAYTRGYFDNWIKAFNRNEKARQFIVGMVDIDCFKSINDTYGHSAGDQVLTFVAKILIAVVDRYGFVVRFGGDEFILVCQEDNTGQAYDLFDDINRRINQENPFDFNISVSYGEQRVPNIDALYSAIEMADENMYQNKKSRTSTIKQTEYES